MPITTGLTSTDYIIVVSRNGDALDVCSLYYSIPPGGPTLIVHEVSVWLDEALKFDDESVEKASKIANTLGKEVAYEIKDNDLHIEKCSNKISASKE